MRSSLATPSGDEIGNALDPLQPKEEECMYTGIQMSILLLTTAK